MTTETLAYMVTADYAQLDAMQRKIQEVNATAGASKAAGAAQSAAFDRVAGRAKYVALGVAAIGAVSYKSAADFESAMNVLEASSEAGGASMEDARKKAIELGNDIKLPGVSAKDAADAMVELAKGGFTMKQSMEASRGVLLLGEAAGMDYATSATIVARSLKAFGLEASDTTTVVDALAGASLKSTASMQEIADGMAYVSTNAKELGIDVVDTSTALAMLNDAGISGSKAGTSLNQMLQRLAPTTVKAKDAMRDLGLYTKKGGSAFYDEKGNFVGMEKASKTLGGALKGMTDEQKQTTLHAIFGVQGMRAAQVVLGKGPKKWNNYRDAVGEAGTAQKIASAKTKGAKGAIEAMTNAVQTAGVAFGTAIAPAVTALLKPVTRLLTWLSQYPGVVMAVVGVIGALAAALYVANAAMKAAQTAKLVAQYFKLAAVASKIWAAAQWLLNAALAANPILLIVIGIIALAAAFVIAYKKSETFRRIVDAAIRAVADAAMWVWNWIKANWPLLIGMLFGPVGIAVALIIRHWGKVKAAAVALKNGIVTAWNAVKSGVSRAVAAIGGYATRMAGFFRDLPGKVVGFLASLPAKVKAKFQAALDAVKGLAGAALGAAKSIGQQIIDGILSGLGGLYQAVKSKIEQGLKSALDAVNPFSPISEGAARLLGAPIVQGTVDGITKEERAVTAALNRMLRQAVRRGNFDQVSELVTRAFQKMQAGQLTVSEAKIAGIERERQVADLQKAYAEATTEADRARAAQDIELFNLREAAERERAVLEQRQYIEQVRMNQQLERLRKAFEKSKNDKRFLGAVGKLAKQIAKKTPPLAIAKPIVQPAVPSAPAGGAGGATVSVGTIVIREEIDIAKLAAGLSVAVAVRS